VTTRAAAGLAKMRYIQVYGLIDEQMIDWSFCRTMELRWNRAVQLCSFGRRQAHALEIWNPENAFCNVYVSTSIRSL